MNGDLIAEDNHCLYLNSCFSGTFRCEVSLSGDTITRVISRQVLVPYDLSNESGGDSTNIIEGVVFLSKSDIKGWSEDLRRNCSHIYLTGVSVDSSTEFGVYQCFTENLDSNTTSAPSTYSDRSDFMDTNLFWTTTSTFISSLRMPDSVSHW